jgi:catechol 2,3-dioxygenase-like lactoylglutathione lyase family enzyme
MAGMVKTRGLYHLHLIVRDLERSLRFYREVFGLEERFRDGPKMVFLSTPGGHDLITLNEDASQREHAGQGGGIDHFGFKLENDADMDAAVAEVLRAGGTLVRRSQPGEGRVYAYVRDPDGYVIEL